MAAIAAHAKAAGAELVVTEGGSHTLVKLGNRRSVVPRHREINEVTAKSIRKQLGMES